MSPASEAEIPAPRLRTDGTADGTDRPSLAQEGYLGDEVCAACHKDLLPHYDRTIHAKVLKENAFKAQWKRGCEACHGPGAAHVAAGGGKRVGGLVPFGSDRPEDVATQNATCMECHNGGNRLYWEGSQHAPADVACTTCHTVMNSVSHRHLLAKSTETQTCAECHLIRAWYSSSRTRPLGRGSRGP